MNKKNKGRGQKGKMEKTPSNEVAEATQEKTPTNEETKASEELSTETDHKDIEGAQPEKLPENNENPVTGDEENKKDSPPDENDANKQDPISQAPTENKENNPEPIPPQPENVQGIDGERKDGEEPKKDQSPPPTEPKEEGDQALRNENETHDENKGTPEKALKEEPNTEDKQGEQAGQVPPQPKTPPRPAPTQDEEEKGSITKENEKGGEQTTNDAKTLDDVPKEKVLQMLKEQMKEAKTAETKLKKVEEKYVKNFKDNKLITKDRETLLKALKLIFPDQTQGEDSIPLGEIQFMRYHDLWVKKQEDTEKELQELRESTGKKLESMDKSAKERLEAELNEVNTRHNEKVQELTSTLEDLEDTNKRLLKDLGEKSKNLTELQQEVIRLKTVEQEYAEKKAELLMKELEYNEKHAKVSEITEGINNSTHRNEVILIKEELETAHEKIRQLEEKLREEEATRSRIAAQLDSALAREKRHEEENKAQDEQKRNHPEEAKHLPAEEQQQEQPPSRRFNLAPPIATAVEEQIPQQSEINTFENYTDYGFGPQQGGESVFDANMAGLFSPTGVLTVPPQPDVNVEYLRHVVMKYFTYKASNNESEAALLEPVIYNILKFTQDDVKTIEEAKKSSRGFWFMAKHVISDSSLFSAKK